MARRDIELKRLIVHYDRRLQRLKEQRASFGLHTPPHILNEIEDIEAAIGELQTELEALENSGVNEESLKTSSKLAKDTNPKLRVRIYIEDDPSLLLSADRQAAAIDGFAAAMGISRQEIEVHHVYPGSIVFDLGIPPSAVQHFRSRLKSNSAQLRLLKVEKVILERESGEIEEWAIEEGKFNLVASTRSTISSDAHGKPRIANIMLWNPRRVFRDALFAWGSLLVAILGASLLYAILVVNQAPETIQVAVPLGAMLAFLLSVYPPSLKLYKEAWSRLQNQAVELWLERNSWEGRVLLFMLALTVVFVLLAVNERVLSIMQMLVLLPLLFASLLVAAEWFDLIGGVWSQQVAEEYKWTERWKMRFLLASMALLWLLSPLPPWESLSEEHHGWALVAIAVSTILTLPLAISLVLLLFFLLRLSPTLLERLRQAVSRVKALWQRLIEEQGMGKRARLGLVLVQDLGLVLGLVLVLGMILPILLLGLWLYSKSEEA